MVLILSSCGRDGHEKSAPARVGKDACMIQFFLRTSDFSHSFKSENVLKRMETVMTSAAKVQQYAKK